MGMSYAPKRIMLDNRTEIAVITLGNDHMEVVRTAILFFHALPFRIRTVAMGTGMDILAITSRVSGYDIYRSVLIVIVDVNPD